MGIGNDGNLFVTKASVMKKRFSRSIRSVSAVQIVSRHGRKTLPIEKLHTKFNMNVLRQQREIVDTVETKTQEEHEQPNELCHLQDLIGIKTVGEGAFGQVKLVKHNKTNTAMALKIQSKRFLKKHKLEKLAANEIQVLNELNHPFINTLHQTFEDKENLYMLLEYIPGGELFSLIGKFGHTFTSCDQRFYTACIMSALESMHKLDIVYRDLKPENVLIDANGYCKLIDFGFSKKITGRTFTSCGTPEYFSPELIRGAGYGKGNDIWSLGVLVYELIFGRNPFSRYTDSKIEVCRKILNRPLYFHKGHKDRNAQHLLHCLLQKSEKKRIGCGNDGFAEIKSHTWFKNFDWAALVRKELPAPWVPSLSSEHDSSNFCEYEENNSQIPMHLHT